LVVDWMPVTRVVFVVVAVVAFALGYAGLDDYLGGQPGHGVLDLIYYDLQLFVLDSAPLQAGGPFPPALEVARFAAPAATAYALAAAVQAILARQLELLRVRRARGHTIVCGAQVHAGFLAQQLRAAGQRVVLIDPAPATRMAVSPPPPGVWHVVGDPRDPAMLRRAGAARAREVVAITSDSAVNAEVAVAMRELASTRRATPVHCFAEVNDRELCAALVAQTLIAHDAPHLRLEFFNQHDRAARSLVDRYPLPGDQDSPPCVLVAGAGRLGQAVVAELARRWDQQRSHGAPPLNLCVLDAKVSAEHLLERIPFVRAVATFHARAADPAEVTSVATLMVPDSTGAVRPPTHVYVCLGSDDDGMAFGLTALRLLAASNPRPELRVVIAVTNSTVFGRVLTTPASSMPSLGPSQLCLHNVVETVYSIDVMRRGIVEDIAKAVHERYVRAAQAKATPSRRTRRWPTGRDYRSISRSPTGPRSPTSATSSAASTAPSSRPPTLPPSPSATTRWTASPGWSTSGGCRSEPGKAGAMAASVTTSGSSIRTWSTGPTCPTKARRRTVTPCRTSRACCGRQASRSFAWSSEIARTAARHHCAVLFGSP
jgi:voltage-gated potassium channel Kch